MSLTNYWKTQILNGSIDHANDTFKVALGGSGTAYTFDQTNHTYVSDVFDGGTTGEEIDYTSPGDRVALANQATSQDDTDNEGVFDADDTTFPSLSTTQDIQFIVVYKQVGGDDASPGDDPIIAIFDDDSAGSVADLPLATNGSDVTISWNSEGIINVQ